MQPKSNNLMKLPIWYSFSHVIQKVRLVSWRWLQHGFRNIGLTTFFSNTINNEITRIFWPQETFSKLPTPQLRYENWASNARFSGWPGRLSSGPRRITSLCTCGGICRSRSATWRNDQILKVCKPNLNMYRIYDIYIYNIYYRSVVISKSHRHHRHWWYISRSTGHFLCAIRRTAAIQISRLGLRGSSAQRMSSGVHNLRATTTTTTTK